jgi:hypothetical protein
MPVVNSGVIHVAIKAYEKVIWKRGHFSCSIISTIDFRVSKDMENFMSFETIHSQNSSKRSTFIFKNLKRPAWLLVSETDQSQFMRVFCLSVEVFLGDAISKLDLCRLADIFASLAIRP